MLINTCTHIPIQTPIRLECHTFNIYCIHNLQKHGEGKVAYMMFLEIHSIFGGVLYKIVLVSYDIIQYAVHTGCLKQWEY